MVRSLFRGNIVFVLLLVVTMPCGGGWAQVLWPQDSPEEPNDFFDLSLEELLDVEIKSEEPGWFGTQLEQLTFDPYVHGYVSAVYRDYDLNRRREVGTFDLHYFNVVVGTRIGERIAAEVLLEYEHGGDDTGVRYGIVDYKIADPAILRFGKFLVPMGRFNEYLSPEYANKLPDRPSCLWRIVPIVWAETGVQLRGQYDHASGWSVNYAGYVVNGLEQPANSDGSVGEGGDIRGMRGNHRDSNDNDKAVGGRVGFKPAPEWEVGVSYYTGAYTVDGRQRLSIMDVDAEYHKDEWTFRGEYVQSLQETSGDDVTKEGFYAEAAYRLNRHLEPVVRYDQVDLEDPSGHNIERSTVGLVIYPEPNLHPLFNFKVSQSFVHDDGTGDETSEFVFQCVIGF